MPFVTDLVFPLVLAPYNSGTSVQLPAPGRVPHENWSIHPVSYMLQCPWISQAVFVTRWIVSPAAPCRARLVRPRPGLRVRTPDSSVSGSAPWTGPGSPHPGDSPRLFRFTFGKCEPSVSGFHLKNYSNKKLCASVRQHFILFHRP